MEMDWVKRKAIGEQFYAEQKEQIWKNLCSSLESAIQSYDLHYGGAAEAHYVNAHHLQITVRSRPPYQNAVVDVRFVCPEVRVSAVMGHSKTATYFLNSNKDAPFRLADKSQLTSDQVSEATLRCVFFPAESRGVPTPIVSPCRSAEAS